LGGNPTQVRIKNESRPEAAFLQCCLRFFVLLSRLCLWKAFAVIWKLVDAQMLVHSWVWSWVCVPQKNCQRAPSRR
jgi:hypothetical protein